MVLLSSLLLLITAPAPSPAFLEALAEAQLDKGKAARKACAKLKRRAVGGEEQARAWAFCGDTSVIQRRYRSALRDYREAQLATARAEERARYLRARLRAARLSKDKAELKRVQALSEADRQLGRIAKQPRRMARTGLKSLVKAERAYRVDRDRPYRARARALRALLLSYSDCEAARPEAREARRSKDRGAQRYGLRAQRRCALKERRTEAALTFALQLDELSDPKGAYASRRLMEVCAAIDAEQGAGSCAQEQLKRRGRVRLLRFKGSKRTAKRGPEALSRVHAYALPALQDCVLKQAQADPERFREASLQLNWAIDRDGRPTAIEVRPRRYADELSGCVAQVQAFRYPPIRSVERQNVSIPYDFR